MVNSFVPSSRARIRAKVMPYDALVAFAASPIAFWLRDYSFFNRDEIASAVIYLGTSLVVSLIAMAYFGLSRIFSRYFSVHDSLVIVKCSAVIVALSSAGVFIVARLDTIPRSIPLIHFLVLVSLLIGGRLASRLLRQRREAEKVARTHEFEERVLLIGANRLGWFFTRIVDSFTLGRHRVVAILDRSDRFQGRQIGGSPVVGRPEDIDSLIAEYRQHGVIINRVVVADEAIEPETELWAWMEGVCARQDVHIEFLPQRLGLWRSDSEPAKAKVANVHAAASDWTADGAAATYWRFRRGLDVAASGALLLLLGPLIGIVALVVAWDVGFPTIFWQERLGRGGKPVKVFKFRSLRAPFDRLGRPVPEDQRLSRLGSFLRATRLDELPQLYNVLRGDMSFIGPRPLLPIDQPTGRSIRLAVAPGITGWAQVHGGKLISPDEKDALDEWYIRNASLRLDIQIVLLTIRAVFRGDERNEAALDAAVREREATTSPPLGLSVDSGA